MWDSDSEPVGALGLKSASKAGPVPRARGSGYGLFSSKLLPEGGCVWGGRVGWACAAPACPASTSPFGIGISVFLQDPCVSSPSGLLSASHPTAEGRLRPDPSHPRPVIGSGMRM